MKKKLALLCSLSLVAFAATPSIAVADGHVSNSPAIWTWMVGVEPAGMTKLVRSRNGLTAQFKTTGLTAGHAVTLWIMFYNNPEACGVDGPNPGVCTPADIPNPATGFDFHYAGGHIVNDSKTTLTGHVRVGEMSTSGWAELGVPSATPLLNPMGAQVILAIHSHGPTQRGRNLAAQLGSYTGGCDFPFLGDDAGFALGSSDVPDEERECSTIQLAFHNP